MKRIALLIAAAILLFGLFYWLNKKNYAPVVRYEKENMGLKQYIKDVYQINPYDFKISSLVHYNDSVYPSITARLLNGGMQLGWYVPENACQDCIIKGYEQLLNLPENIQDKIFIMTSFTKERDVKMWIGSRKYKYPVYNNPSFGMSDYGAKNQLTLFLVKESGIPTDFFILKRDFFELSDDYFKHVIYEFEKETGNAIYDEAATTGEKPEIKAETKHDLGEINLNEKAVTFFEFENLSSVPFIITEVTSNCGCTAPEWDRRPAKQGEKLKVKVEFTAKEAGFFSKRITVFSNAKGSPHTLTITGNVKQKN